MKHRWCSWGLAACLALVLMVAMAPISAFAADAAVKSNGVQLQDGVPVACGEGTAVLDQQQKTLTLTNATITQEAATPALDIRGGELCVVLVGENKIITGNQRAIYASNIDLVISGSELDSLVVQTDADAIQVDKGNLTIDGCKVQINSTTWGGITC